MEEVMKRKCWCDYPPSRCGNICCEDVKKKGRWYPHRTSIYLSIHADESAMAEVICGNKIKFCPVCGKPIKSNPD